MDDTATATGLPSLDKIITCLQSNPLYLDEPISTREAAPIAGHTPKTLEKFRCVGGGPEYRKIGGKVVYTRRTCLEYLLRGRRTSTSDRGQSAG